VRGVLAILLSHFKHPIAVELKTVDDLSNAHYAQVRSYLKATGLPVALLVNFAKEKADPHCRWVPMAVWRPRALTIEAGLMSG